MSVLQHASTAAAAALALAGSDPTGAVEAARSAERMARRERNPAALSTAQRARGLARRELGDLPAALAALRASVRTAELAGLPEPAAEARMSLAFALLQRGRPAAALAEADLAAQALTATAAARLQAQRAVVLQRCGRFDEALEEFRTALPVLQRAGDRLWEARLRNNRGLLHTDRGDLDAAEVDLTRSGELYTALGHHLLAANTASGLGDVAAKRGDICAALACYDHAAARYAGSDVPVPELLVDRAKVLLAAGLVDEAQQCADRAAAELRALLRDTDVAEVELLQAQCALALGNPRQAARSPRRPKNRLRRQHRPGWALVARYVRLRAAAATDDRVDVAAAGRTADALQAAGWRAPLARRPPHRRTDSARPRPRRPGRAAPAPGDRRPDRQRRPARTRLVCRSPAAPVSRTPSGHGIGVAGRNAGRRHAPGKSGRYRAAGARLLARRGAGPPGPAVSTDPARRPGSADLVGALPSRFRQTSTGEPAGQR